MEKKMLIISVFPSRSYILLTSFSDDLKKKKARSENLRICPLSNLTKVISLGLV